MSADAIPTSRLRSGFSKSLIFMMVAAFSLSVIGLAGCGDDDGGETPPVTTGTVSGTVLTAVDEAPVQGAVVTLTPTDGQAPTSATTDAGGGYEFTGVEQGTYDLLVDASGVTVDPANADLEYVNWSTRITVVAGDERVVDGHLTIVDTSEAATVTAGQETVLELSSMAGLRLEIEADAVTFPDGSHTGDLYVVELGYDQGPISLLPGYGPTVMIQIIPQGTTFDPPATVRFPNRDSLPIGSDEELFSFDADTQMWVSEGLCSVGEFYVTGDAGTGIGTASTHFIVCEAHSVTGTLLGDMEEPVAGATVQLHGYMNPFLEGRTGYVMEGMTATSNAEGVFVIAAARVSQVGVSAQLVSAEAVGLLEPTFPVVRSETGVTDLETLVMDMTTESLFDVTGVVTYENGSPAVGVGVGLYDPSQQVMKAEPYYTETGADGSYLFENVQWEPGADVAVWAYDEINNWGTDELFQAPSLAQSGTTITIDLRLCDPDAGSICGEWGTWSLDGDEATLNWTRIECGEEVSETEVVTVLSLQNGVLTVRVPQDGGGYSVESMPRVQGYGPTGISSTNLVGLYYSDGGSFVLGFYADGTMNWVEGPGLQGGTYAVDGSDLLADFLFQNDPEGPPLGENTLPFSVLGDTFTVTPPESSPEVFSRCDNGPDNGLEGLWYQEYGGGSGFRLLFYRGEFAGVGYGYE